MKYYPLVTWIITTLAVSLIGGFFAYSSGSASDVTGLYVKPFVQGAIVATGVTLPLLQSARNTAQPARVQRLVEDGWELPNSYPSPEV